MSFYCCTWGKLFARKSVERLMMILYGVLLYAGLIWLVSLNGAGEQAIVWMILAAIAVIPFLLFHSLRDNKLRFITVSKTGCSWQQILFRVEPRGGRYVRQHYDVYSVTVRVENIRNIAFKQNVVERWFNIGRVSFIADVRSYKTEHGTTPPVVPPDSPYEFAGVKSFRRFKEYLHQELPSSAFRIK